VNLLILEAILIAVLSGAAVFGGFYQIWKKCRPHNPGEPELKFLAAPIVNGSGQADISLQAFTIRGSNEKALFEVVTSSFRGNGHVQQRTPNQDSFASFETQDHLFLVLSDGVSNSEKSHVGSRLLTSRAKSVILENVRPDSIFSTDAWEKVNETLTTDVLREYLLRSNNSEALSELTTQEIRINAADLFAATFEVLAIDKKVSAVTGLHTFVFVRIAGDGALIKVSGNLASVKNVLIENSQSAPKLSQAVSALPVCDLKPQVFEGSFAAGETLLFMTDGLGDLANSTPFIRALKVLAGANISVRGAFEFSSILENLTSDDRTMVVIRCV
jgi:serine/threonine protein phosphatase PrpC